ncbi:MAG TPA: phosphodiester glycosidase family protein, partial [Arthrobacter sp.]|nr:phosphodiester glycosidase family protein [Arthrobacter sp.]
SSDRASAETIQHKPVAAELDLGAPLLAESRTVEELAPGVTLTSIDRRSSNTDLFWTVEVKIPSGTGGIADAAVAPQGAARQVVAGLAARGVDARLEHVVSAELDDSGGDLGYRVRVGEFASREEGAASVAKIRAAGYSSSVWYSGWDGDSAGGDQQRGPWNIDVLTIDPKKFDGRLAASFGPDLERRETTSELAAQAGALAAVNAGFFVFNAQHGAEGDPAGAGAYSGQVLSEAVGDRPALVIDGRKATADVERLGWRGTVKAGSDRLALDGINRVPGLIRNCGGTADDLPTAAPLHDATCTDTDELVAFTPEFGGATPAGPGTEVVLDAEGRVIAVNNTRGTAVPAGGHTVQATGTEAARLAAIAEPGRKLKISSEFTGPDGKNLHLGKDSHVVSGGPYLVQNGEIAVTAARDGLVHADNPGMFYGWVHQRNPRTIAGIDAQGRLILVTADGRQSTSLGLSIYEAAKVAKSLGMVEAINLDGGGSTTMTAGGEVVNVPSNAGGTERGVGDALLVLPQTAG